MRKIVVIISSLWLCLAASARDITFDDLYSVPRYGDVQISPDGSQVLTHEGTEAIPVVKPNKVADPTGAGDAYRAGLIFGLVQGKNLKQGALIGSVSSSFAVECYGTQEYSFTRQEFEHRLKKYSG